MSDDINIGALSEALNNKADVDFNNVADAGKENSVGWGMPDYSGIVTITFPYTAVCDGEVRFNLDGGSSSTTTVNGNTLPLMGNDNYNEGPVVLRVSKGAVVTASNPINAFFIPYKGVN